MLNHETCPNHLSFPCLTRIRSSSYFPMAAWIFLRASSLVTKRLSTRASSSCSSTARASVSSASRRLVIFLSSMRLNSLPSCYFRRILFSSRGEIFGQWDVEFTYTWAELKEKPKLSPKGIEVSLKEKEKKKFLFGSSSSKKEIHISDKKIAEV